MHEIVVTAASNYKVLHLASVMSVSVTGKCASVSQFMVKLQGLRAINDEDGPTCSAAPLQPAPLWGVEQ